MLLIIRLSLIHISGAKRVDSGSDCAFIVSRSRWNCLEKRFVCSA